MIDYLAALCDMAVTIANQGVKLMPKVTIASLQAEHTKAMTDLHNSFSEAMSKSEMYAKETSYVKQQLITAEKALKEERESHNLTRDVLHSTELELAKTRGYLDAKQDAEPPLMVPQHREGHLASYADGSRSLTPNWQSPGFNERGPGAKPWWHK